jgi:hypothetical protein
MASTTFPPDNPPGPRRMSKTPVPWSVRLHFIAGKAIPWSVVQTTRVLSARPVASRVSRISPTAASQTLTLALKSATSRRVSGVSGRGAGGRQ